MGGQNSSSSHYTHGPLAYNYTHHRYDPNVHIYPRPEPYGDLPCPPLLFHPRAKGTQILIDPSQKIVRRKASFCDAIVFSSRPVTVNEVVRLEITDSQRSWQGALRVGFTTTDPSEINPEMLPKYSCPDLAAKPGFWVKALPEELLYAGNVISFWVNKKGRVFYQAYNSNPKRLFSHVDTWNLLWVLIDVYGQTKGVQLLDSEVVPQDFGTLSIRRKSVQQRKRGAPLPLSLFGEEHLQECCEEHGGHHHHHHDHHHSFDHLQWRQHSQSEPRRSRLPDDLDTGLHVHPVHSAHVHLPDPHTAMPLPHAGREGAVVFTSRPLECWESVHAMVRTSGPASLSYGVTSCDPSTLKPGDLPSNLDSLVDRKEFWALDKVSVPLHNDDVLSFAVTEEGEVMMGHNGVSVGVQLCVDNSKPLWIFFGLHSNISQLKILGSSLDSDVQHGGNTLPPKLHMVHEKHRSLPSPTGSSLQSLSPPSSPSWSRSSVISSNEFNLNTVYDNLHNARSSQPSASADAEPTSPPYVAEAPSSAPVSEECAICYDNTVDTVLYACGHMCLCYTCAFKLKKDNSPCPICRKKIRDIIKTFRSS
ncbi:E3 ubiquitin-protein ligase NEURL1-like isoform X2 [Dunckerocampus dactyliophorus]|uniref:E3 ubiquitin-protein ligase NEURL1-like isoform X2 n=1 Tax=Dunckerocampus dactyliophorus TaxID=161453 RepID=UPI0024051CC8|nr:E3 ubiquitin-protein ligase NEURL1-like isoform X2 [Dunckerocampus dactyliophorus]